MPAVYPSPQSVFIPDHDATNKMVVDFARNINSFAVNRYTQVVPVKKVAGYYLEMTVEEAGRILNADLKNFVWPDGQPAPEGNDGLESHVYKPFATTRRAFPFLLGDLTADQASWNIIASHSSIKARQAMTARTQLVINQATNTNNYAVSHVLDVPSISGNTGNWAQSTTARQDIKRSLNRAAQQILKSTLAAVRPEDLHLVISPDLAAEMSESQEIVDYIKGSPHALAQIKGELPGRNVLFGLPDKLYGYNVEVEDAYKVTSKKGATRAVSSVLAKGTPFMVSRPGGLVGVADAPNFSTLVLFAQEEMTVEVLQDVNNRRKMGRVVENTGAYVVAPASGVMFQNAA